MTRATAGRAADRLEEIIAQASGDTRAAKVHEAACQLRENSVYSRILLCELTHEASTCRNWKVLRTADGLRYAHEVQYLRDLWGVKYSRNSIALRKRLGAALQRYESSQREWLRQALVPLGLAKAFILAVPLGIADDVAQCEHWLAMARKAHVSPNVLRSRVTAVYKDQMPSNRRGRAPTAMRCDACGRPYRRRPAEVPLVAAGDRA